MACSINLPPKVECSDVPVFRFGKATGIVSEMSVDETGFSFEFGANRQLVNVENHMAPDWLRNGVKVEIDFDTQTIVLIRDTGWSVFMDI